MYEAIKGPVKGLLLVRILMTVCAFEFFGPWGRDYSQSHLFNPDWVGHARVHMMWLLGFFLFSGIANVYLIWFVRPLRLIHLYTSFAWLATNFLGFWLAVVWAPQYDGMVTVPHEHIPILGIDENVFVFGVLSTFYIVALGLLFFRVEPRIRAAAQ